MRLVAALLTFLLLGAASALPGFADDASDLQQRVALAKQVLNLTAGDSGVAEMTDAIWPAVANKLRVGGQPPSDGDLARMKLAFSRAISQAAAGAMDDYAMEYAEDFTLDELQAYLAFYQSEAGQKWLTLRPQITRKMLPELLSRVQTSLPDILKSVEQVGN